MSINRMLLIALLVSVSACQTTDNSAKIEAPCPNLALISGKLSFVESFPLDGEAGNAYGIENWRSRQVYDMSVEKVHFGYVSERKVRVSLIAHSRFRDDKPFRLLVERHGPASFEVLWDFDPDIDEDLEKACDLISQRQSSSRATASSAT